MKKIHLGILSLLLVVTATACEQTIQKQEGASNHTPSKFYFTANEGGSITKIDSAQNKVADTIKVDGAVHNVQVSPDGKILGATLVPAMQGKMNHGGMEMKGMALFYDTSSNQLIKKVEVGNHPAHIVFTGDQKYALVTNNEDNTISVIDMATYQIVKTVSTGKGPHGFRSSADNKFAYIANMGEDSISVIDLASMSEVRKIKVGNSPVTTGVTSDSKLLVVPLNSENAAVIVDLGTDKVDKVPVGAGPAQVYIQSDNKFAILANQGTEQKPSHSITKIDLTTKKAVATIDTGKGSHGVVISKDNKWIYVTNMFDNTVSVIDNVQNKEVAEIKVGQIPNGISIMP